MVCEDVVIMCNKVSNNTNYQTLIELYECWVHFNEGSVLTPGQKVSKEMDAWA